MSRWRLLTGTSTGSQTVPPLWWRNGLAVGELHEVPEVLDRAVAPAAVEVADERRAVVRGEDGVRPADLDVVVRVAGDLGELARGASPGRSGGTSRAGSGRARPGRRRRRSRSRSRAAASPRNSSPTSWRIVSAFSSMIERPSSLRTSNGASVRVRNGSRAMWVRARAACRPARPPVRWRGDSSTVIGPPSRPTTTARRRRPPPSGRAPTSRSGAALRQLRDLRQVGRRRRPVGEGHRLDEMLLEARLDRGLDLLDPPDDVLDLAPRGGAEQRDQGAGARRRCRRP